MKLSSSNCYILSKKDFCYIFSKESLTYISENGTLHFSAQARKMIHPEKNFHISGNGNSEKTSYISYILGNGTFESKA